MNTIDRETKREEKSSYLQERLKLNTIASQITNIKFNGFNDKIHNPYSSNVNVQTSSNGIVQELDIDDFTISDEVFEMTDSIAIAEKINPADLKYSNVNILSDRETKSIDEKLITLDEKVVATIAATPGIQTISGLITSADTAKVAARQMSARMQGFATKMDQYIVINNQTLEHFLEAGASRETLIGDGVFKTGELYTISGLKVLVVRKTSVIETGKALGICKGAAYTYIDEAGLVEDTYQAQASTVNKVNLNKVYVSLQYFGTKVWKEDVEKVVLKGAAVTSAQGSSGEEADSGVTGQSDETDTRTPAQKSADTKAANKAKKAAAAAGTGGSAGATG